MKRPVITLLTDFGTADYYVGAMKGVILSVCRDAHIIDITHEIHPWQVAQGGAVLAQAWSCFPPGTIHVAVVDPGVGSARQPILAEAGGHFFVAPDNGILTQVFAAAPPAVVRAITASQYFRHPVSSTFHGRDIFAPVAAHLASGVTPEQFGGLHPDFTYLHLAKPTQIDDHAWRGEVWWVDHYGNVVTCFDVDCFDWVAEHIFELKIGGEIVTRYGQYYGAMEGGAPHVVFGSSGCLEVSVNQQDAAKSLGVRAGQELILRRL